MNNGTIGNIEYNFKQTPYYYICRIKTIPHIPKVCPFCGSSDIMDDIVHVKTGLTKNNLKSQYSFLCFPCETLMVVTDKMPFIIIKPTLENKLVVRNLQLIQVYNDEFLKTDYIKPTLTFNVNIDAIELTKGVLFEFEKKEIHKDEFGLHISDKATNLINDFCNDKEEWLVK